MEGDVLSSVWAPLLTVGGAVLGGMFALLKWFAARLLADIEARLARIDAVAREVDRVDADLKRLTAELPINYQRRDDAIREMNAANERYQRVLDNFIVALRRDIEDTGARLAAIERARETERMTYYLRDDAIREFSAINMKLDRLYELLAKGQTHD